MKKASIIFIGLLLLLMACRPDPMPHDTIVVLGDEGYVIPMRDLIPDEWEPSFFEDFGTTPDEGYFPPVIEGEYHISKKQFVASSLDYDLSDTLDMYLQLFNQHNRVVSVALYEGGTVWTETAFVSGSGSRFALYFVETRELVSYGTTHAHDRFVLITGKMGDDGIHDLHFGSMILSAYNGDDVYVGAFIPGWYFIYKDKDGLSEFCHFFDYSEGEDD